MSNNDRKLFLLNCTRTHQEVNEYVDFSEIYFMIYIY